MSIKKLKEKVVAYGTLLDNAYQTQNLYGPTHPSTKAAFATAKEKFDELFDGRNNGVKSDII